MRPPGISIGQWLQYNLQFIIEHVFGYSFVKNRLGKWREALQAKVSQDLNIHNKNESSAYIYDGPIPKDFNFSDTFTRKKTAWVFRGGAASWPACSRWDLEFFKEHYGDRKIVFNVTAGVIDPNNPIQFEETTLSQYIDDLKKGSRKYLKFSDLVQNETALQADLGVDLLEKFHVTGATGKTFYTFMGAAGTITPLHNEFPCNIYVQISGKKKWIVYPIDDRIFLDPRTERRPYFFSSVNPYDINDPKYPLLKHAHRIEIILEPGDMICVPPFVWHYIENVTDSIGVAYKFAHIPSSLRSSKLLTTLFLLSTRPSIFYTFIANRLKKDDVLVQNY